MPSLILVVVAVGGLSVDIGRMGKIALAIAFGSLAIAVAIALSNRYSMSVTGGGGGFRRDHITGEIVYCGAAEKAGTFCVQFPTDQIRTVPGAAQPQQ